MRKLLSLQIRRGFAETPYIVVDIHDESKGTGPPYWTTLEEARETAAELLEISNRVEKMERDETT